MIFHLSQLTSPDVVICHIILYSSFIFNMSISFLSDMIVIILTFIPIFFIFAGVQLVQTYAEELLGIQRY